MDEGTGFLKLGAGSSERLVALEGSGLLSRALALDARLAEREAERVLVYWHATPTHASAIGYRLVTFDREARRATRIVRSGDMGQHRPLPMSSSGFEVREASQGSVDLLLEAIGLTAQVLLSHPVQLILTTRSLIGDVRRVVGWLGRRISAAQQSSLPDIRDAVETILAEREDTEMSAPPELTWGEHGPQVRGAVDVTIVRMYPDGGVDFIHFEGAGPR